ncbi:phage holin family protein [Janthinobacterium agaricidamnosum]|uniref:Protein n=1 Tax=Janthinobacterium agaricidamnosum NBRC 102515 = DSM 9628 TaxID=1349767 RepID=W0V8J5_9BURK|nr:phage holin family protein [Janthinobacterium agaricidamnosum]CDG85144.1 protein [Janthinobacterium agaricidamnosum NBRC 102515 = DSM 9628]
MAIAQSLGRIATTLVAIIRTRMELAAVEMEEESLRFLAYLALGLLAMLCMAITILLLVFLILVLFWDSYRIASIIVSAAVFAALGVAIVLGVRHHFRHKPKLLSFTLAELNKDLDSMQALGRIR